MSKIIHEHTDACQDGCQYLEMVNKLFTPVPPQPGWGFVERCDVCEKLTTLREREGLKLCRQCESVLDA